MIRCETKKSPLNDFSDKNFEQMWSEFTKRKNQSAQIFVKKRTFREVGNGYIHEKTLLCKS
jgi:hypothetical protein